MCFPLDYAKGYGKLCVSNQQMETLCIGTRSSVPQALAQSCAVSLDKPQAAVCMSNFISLPQKVLYGSLVQSSLFSYAEESKKRATQLNMCLGSCDSF